MTLLLSFLDLLLASWVFFPLAGGLTLWAYYGVSSSVKDDDGLPAGSTFLLALVAGAILYRYPAARHVFSDWRGWIEVVGGYALAGFLLSLYKWVMVLVDFRKLDVARQITLAKAAADRHSPQNNAPARLIEAVNDLERDHQRCRVIGDAATGTITIYPDWHKHSIATHWALWPFFLFSVILDPLKRAVERLLSWCRAFYDGLAQRFAVKG